MTDDATNASPPQAKPNRKLFPAQMTPAEHIRLEYVAEPEAGTTIAEMQEPAYWAHVAGSLRVGARIEVRPKDGTWWGELLVRAIQPFSVVVHVLRTVDFVPKAEVGGVDVPDGYEVRSLGRRGWAVQRSADNVELSRGHPTQEAAAAWLTGHMRALAA